jgi:signal transduction histidine kinase
MSVAIPHTKSNLRTGRALYGFAPYEPPEVKFLALQAEQLRKENESLRKRLEENEKFKETAEYAAHDIRSPLLVLLVGLKMCENLSEKERAMFSDSIASIQKIAQGFLESSKNRETKQEDQHILVSQALQNTVNQKIIQYNDKNIDFQYSFDPSLRFAFIYGNHLNFERMMSNIINNSAEAFEDKKGAVKVELSEDDKNVKITVQDDGKGMPPETVEKLMKGESISTTKHGGFGVGATQIQKTVRAFNGKLFIESEQEVGTKITLTIPKLHCP